MNNRQKITIAIIVFVILSIATIIIAVIQQNSKQQANQDTSKTYTDPGSGETVIENDNGPTTASGEAPTTPIFLGFSQLTSRGLSVDQVELIKASLSAYSSKQTDQFKEVSLTISTINRLQPADDNAPDALEFSIKTNRTNDYFVHVEYTSISSITTKLFTSDKTTLLFTQ